MPVQPIDLQTLFSQIDKVGKSESAQKEGAQLQAAVQNARIQQKTLEKDHAVNETRDTGQGGTEQVKDRKGRGGGGRQTRYGQARNGPASPESPEYVRDPDLGRNLDVSG